MLEQLQSDSEEVDDDSFESEDCCWWSGQDQEHEEEEEEKLLENGNTIVRLTKLRHEQFQSFSHAKIADDNQAFESKQKKLLGGLGSMEEKFSPLSFMTPRRRYQNIDKAFVESLTPTALPSNQFKQQEEEDKTFEGSKGKDRGGLQKVPYFRLDNIRSEQYDLLPPLSSDQCSSQDDQFLD